MVNVYLTSDLHLGHAKLLDFRSERHSKLFLTVQHWNDYIITKWNDRINPRDIVWVLGDVVMGGDNNLKLLHGMNGHKRLILGNHDGHDMRKFLPYFERIAGVAVKYDVVMSHVPIHKQELAHRWTTNVHGHIHHKGRNLQAPDYINVNVDVRNGEPVSIDEIREEIHEATKVSTNSIQE